jgi:hypothetical protein
MRQKTEDEHASTLYYRQGCTVAVLESEVAGTKQATTLESTTPPVQSYIDLPQDWIHRFHLSYPVQPRPSACPHLIADVSHAASAATKWIASSNTPRDLKYVLLVAQFLLLDAFANVKCSVMACVVSDSNSFHASFSFLRLGLPVFHVTCQSTPRSHFKASSLSSSKIILLSSAVFLAILLSPQF